MLKPVVALPYRGGKSRLRLFPRRCLKSLTLSVLRFARYLRSERIKYAIRLPARHRILQEKGSAYLLTRPARRPQPNEVRRSYASFNYQAGSWTNLRRVVAKVEWHPGELYPRVGFIVTNMARVAENVVAFYNKRGTRASSGSKREQGRYQVDEAVMPVASPPTRFAFSFMRSPTISEISCARWRCPSRSRNGRFDEPKGKADQGRREKVVSHGRYVAFQMAEVAVQRTLFADVLRMIAELRPPPVASTA